ncbi:tRNA1(Val) (adenine(37)-N6)-methyltransferase [Dyadobacter sediminis]|uniref:tRNA1(Val) (adenine(37)-N6)-methyltransferase n=1 Tax=Dyadobacter sediminis TaxID=1493691 RepID=A0A5R9KAR8_9BACT|nr:methyltransferase [Dyadobacter sediminis]TLU91910.1 methyltransferase [Dyadobacter sediminis]GGB99212.1 tRNA1(Val) (adenine(37)-N6)-methyltransferase [Dyadobacter sediminis]
MARNSTFHFKQFTIWQDKCAMKVCTDACVFGAWTNLENAGRVLDIGAGTGLLSLMSAQRNTHARIDAVEIDTDAFEQAGENVAKSPFHNRIKLYHTAIQLFDPGFQYDVIISNPPFFQDDLKSPDKKKNLAHHAHSLDFEELVAAVNRLLLPSGKFQVLFPVEEGTRFQQKAENAGLVLNRKLALCHHSGKNPFRLLMEFQKTEKYAAPVIENVLYIYENDGVTYHPSFRDLMKDFYLIF